MSEVLNATHQGVLKIGDLELQCYNLKGGKRVFHKKALANALALKSKGGSAFIRTVTRKNIWAELNENARINIENPIEFRWLGNDLKCRLTTSLLQPIVHTDKIPPIKKIKRGCGNCGCFHFGNNHSTKNVSTPYFMYGCRGRIRTCDLAQLRQPSYQTALP